MNSKFGDFIFCSCGTHAISIYKSKLDEDNIDTNISLWRDNASSWSHYSLWNRIIFAFNILFKKKFFADAIVLDKETVKELIDVLQSIPVGEE